MAASCRYAFKFQVMEGLDICTCTMTDMETGEIIFRSRPVEVTFEMSTYPIVFVNWLMSYYRGLMKGRQLSLTIEGSPFQLPVQKEIF